MPEQQIVTGPAAKAEPTGPDHRSNVPVAAVGLALGIVLSVLDQTVVAIALPDIAADLGGLGSISWVVTAYVLASTATGTLYGRLSDRFGRRATFLTALTVFSVASLLCALAQTMAQLVAFRTLQGVGAGALFAVPTIALAELVRPELRGRVQGYVGGLFALASLAGPLVGGALTDAAGWRWIFYVNLPVGLLSMVLVMIGLRLPRPEKAVRVDIVGSVLLVGGVVALILGTEWGGRTYPWGSAIVLSLLAAAVALFATFVWWERRVPHPILPMRLFRNPTVRAALPGAFVLGALLYGSIVFLPTYLQSAFGFSATEAGLALNPYVLAFVAASAAGGAAASATGRPKMFLIAGPLVIIAAFGLLSRLGANSSYPTVAAALVVLGIGIGLIMQLLVAVTQNAVEPADLAATSAAVLSIRGLGMTIGVAFFGSLLARTLASGPETPDRVAQAIPDVLLWAIPLAAVLLLLMSLVPGNRTPPAASDSTSTPVDRAGRRDPPGPPARPYPTSPEAPWHSSGT